MGVPYIAPLNKKAFYEGEPFDKREDYKPELMEPVILEYVENGIKATELVAYIVELQHAKDIVYFKPNEDSEPGLTHHGLNLHTYEQIGDPIQYIQKLINEGKIIELEYVLPHMDYRAKSMYFPVGTKMTIITGRKEEAIKSQATA